MADARRGEIDIPESESAAVTMTTPEISESPEGDVARQGQPPTVASATERPASPGVASDNREPLPRIALLQKYKTAIGRSVYPEKALDALKLRYAAEIHYQKDIFIFIPVRSHDREKLWLELTVTADLRVTGDQSVGRIFRFLPGRIAQKRSRWFRRCYGERARILVE
jgi:hypothetical protein